MQFSAYVCVYYISIKSFKHTKFSLKIFFFLAEPCGLQDLGSLTRDQTWAMAVEVQSLDHWTVKKSQFKKFFKNIETER